MKVIQEKQFTPVSVLLETQQEVDQLYAIFNHNPIVSGTAFEDAWNLLKAHRSQDSEKWRQLMVSRLKN